MTVSVFRGGVSLINGIVHHVDFTENISFGRYG